MRRGKTKNAKPEPASECSLGQQVALQSLLKGSTVQHAAEEAGVTARTLYRWLNESAFKKELRIGRYEAVANALSMAVQAAPVAMHTLIRLMHDTTASGQARVSASVGVLKFTQDTIGMLALEEKIDDIAEAQKRVESMDAIKIADGESEDFLARFSRNKPS